MDTPPDDILGVNTRWYPNMHDPENPVLIRVVLVKGAIGDYAAYVGSGTIEWVARRGDKISFEEACAHFPGGQLERAKYRD